MARYWHSPLHRSERRSFGSSSFIPFEPELGDQVVYVGPGQIEVLGHRGVRRAAFANRAVQVANDLDEIIKAIEVYA